MIVNNLVSAGTLSPFLCIDVLTMIASILFEHAVPIDSMRQAEGTPQCSNVTTYTGNVTKDTCIAETPTSVVITSQLDPYAPGSNHLIVLTIGITAPLLLIAVIFTILISFIPLILCLKSRRLNRPTVSTLNTGEVVTLGLSNKMDCTTELHTTSSHDGLQGKDASNSPQDNQIETTVNEAYGTTITGTKKNEVCGTIIGSHGVVVNEYECVN